MCDLLVPRSRNTGRLHVRFNDHLIGPWHIEHALTNVGSAQHVLSLQIYPETEVPPVLWTDGDSECQVEALPSIGVEHIRTKPVPEKLSSFTIEHRVEELITRLWVAWVKFACGLSKQSVSLKVEGDVLRYIAAVVADRQLQVQLPPIERVRRIHSAPPSDCNFTFECGPTTLHKQRFDERVWRSSGLAIKAQPITPVVLMRWVS